MLKPQRKDEYVHMGDSEWKLWPDKGFIFIYRDYKEYTYVYTNVYMYIPYSVFPNFILMVGLGAALSQ